MSQLLRGYRTGPAGVPSGWRGPLPDLSVQRHLDVKGDGGGSGRLFSQVPSSLLLGMPPLGVMTWVLLRLSFGDRASRASYGEFAAALGLGHLTTAAIEKRFGGALRPLLGTWIIREPAPSNEYTYRAAVPSEAEGDRYAIVRRCDLQLLTVARRDSTVTANDLTDFGRWQLECGRRGWTADSLRTIARRWGVSHATMHRSRDRLAELRLLEVEPRSGGRHTDLVWLHELYDPHWRLPSRELSTGRSDEVDSCIDRGGRLSNRGGPCVTSEGGRLSDGVLEVGLNDRGSLVSAGSVPKEELLTGCLTGDESDLGGASVPPVKSVTRDVCSAPPAASRTRTSTQSRQAEKALARRLIDRHRTLATADHGYHEAMVDQLADSLAGGVDPRFAQRALARVVEEGRFDRHLPALRESLRQARSDQIVGMCASCGYEPAHHGAGCPEDAEPGELRSPPPDAGGEPPPRRCLIPPSEPVDRSKLAPTDPFQKLTAMPTVPMSEEDDDATKASKLAVHISHLVAELPDRQTGLRRWWHAQQRSGRVRDREWMADAVAHVDYALRQGTGMAS